MPLERRLPVALLLLRLSVFLVMLVWTLDKFINPEHVTAVYERFYFLADVGPMLSTALGALEVILLAAFVLGLLKTWTYGAVLALHAVSTLSTWQLYLAPFENLLFFAAWPMLAACFALFWLRDADTLATVGSPRPNDASAETGVGAR